MDYAIHRLADGTWSTWAVEFFNARDGQPFRVSGPYSTEHQAKREANRIHVEECGGRVPARYQQKGT